MRDDDGDRTPVEDWARDDAEARARLPRPWVFGPLAALPAAILAELAGCAEARIDTGSALRDIATWYVVFAIGFALSARAARNPP